MMTAFRLLRVSPDTLVQLPAPLATSLENIDIIMNLRLEEKEELLTSLFPNSACYAKQILMWVPLSAWLILTPIAMIVIV